MERWHHRADLAEQAIIQRHATRLWGWPRTNLAVISWPPTTRDKFFVRWHYWWQAHYVDAQVDAALRRPTPARLNMIRRTVRSIRIRSFGRLSSNSFYDDKAWLALAYGRVEELTKCGRVRGREDLVRNIFEGVDGLTGVLPWRAHENFYNVPTNGPAAILAAREGELELAESLVDWVFSNLINEKGLVMDGLHMRMHGPTPVATIHSYCQGVMLGACTQLAMAQRNAAGVGEGEVSSVGINHITRVHQLVDAISEHMTDENRVIRWGGGSGGDGGLFQGILIRYLALVATSLPGSSDATHSARARAKEIVLQSAQSAWRYRLEVDGLPVFSADWGRDAKLPQSGGLLGSTLAGAVSSSDIAERDLSVQLSGWMAMEAAAAVFAAEESSAALPETHKEARDQEEK